MPRTKPESLRDLQRNLALACAEANAKAERKRQAKEQAETAMFRAAETKRMEREIKSQQRLLAADAKKKA